MCIFVENTKTMKRLPIFITALALVSSVAVAEELKLREDNISQIVKAMTLEEKAHLVVGADMKKIAVGGEVGDTNLGVPGAAGITYPIPRLGIPSIVMADGPAGLRISPKRENDPNTYYCTGFPVGTHLAATWNDDIIYQVGVAMGEEVKEYGVDILLAPGINIMRNPLCGRNFEYYSEDPLLAGRTAAAIINGVESNDVGTSLKHFCANNQEINRLGNDSRVSQRALREIYLRNFEIAVQLSQPWTIMTSYNYLNGRYTSEDKGLLEDVLRGEFGFEGMIVTDWGGGLDAAAQMAAGNDMIQPGAPRHYDRILAAVKDGTLSEADLDKCVARVLELIVKTPKFKGYKFTNKPDLKAHAAVTREVASEGFVLLKNESKALPMVGGQTVALFGVGSYDFIAGGRGSGDVSIIRSPVEEGSPSVMMCISKSPSILPTRPSSASLIFKAHAALSATSSFNFQIIICLTIACLLGGRCFFFFRENVVFEDGNDVRAKLNGVGERGEKRRVGQNVEKDGQNRGREHQKAHRL